VAKRKAETKKSTLSTDKKEGEGLMVAIWGGKVDIEGGKKLKSWGYESPMRIKKNRNETG